MQLCNECANYSVAFSVVDFLEEFLLSFAFKMFYIYTFGMF